jgi:hypothetical protein
MMAKKLLPKDKHDTKWWQKRNASRLSKQDQHAKQLKNTQAVEELIGKEAE